MKQLNLYTCTQNPIDDAPRKQPLQSRFLIQFTQFNPTEESHKKSKPSHIFYSMVQHWFYMLACRISVDKEKMFSISTFHNCACVLYDRITLICPMQLARTRIWLEPGLLWLLLDYNGSWIWVYAYICYSCIILK